MTLIEYVMYNILLCIFVLSEYIQGDLQEQMFFFACLFIGILIGFILINAHLVRRYNRTLHLLINFSNSHLLLYQHEEMERIINEITNEKITLWSVCQTRFFRENIAYYEDYVEELQVELLSIVD